MMDDLSGSDSDYAKYWIDWFLGTKGNEYFCEVDGDFITDRFNLTGLNGEVQRYQDAIDLITDTFDQDCSEEVSEQIEKSARHLYGLIHARYILSTRGLQKMVEKFKQADFGHCPRMLCNGYPLLPVGLTDVARQEPVKLFCMKCEDIYNPKSNRHAAIDGSYFGTSFPGLLFQVFPHIVPLKTGERFTPRIFGFKLHEKACLARWQEQKRLQMIDRLEQYQKQDDDDQAARRRITCGDGN